MWRIKALTEQGSPPRMRGKDQRTYPRGTRPGITPAHAGKRGGKNSGKVSAWDHPRACGEKFLSVLHVITILGSPPRMRGKVRELRESIIRQGITPAHAGKRPPPTGGGISARDHPRACGEKLSTDSAGCQVPGSPPRMRGKATSTISHNRRMGITPAHAGKSQF